MCVVRVTCDGDGADGALEKHVSIRPIVRRCIWVCVCAFTCVCVCTCVWAFTCAVDMRERLVVRLADKAWLSHGRT